MKTIEIEGTAYRVADNVAELILMISVERDHYEDMLRRIQQDIIAADLNVKVTP